MKKEYNDFLISDNMEEMARAYSARMKEKGFVFVCLEKEESQLLKSEILILMQKMTACTKKLEKSFDCKMLQTCLDSCQKLFCRTFDMNPHHNFLCIESAEKAFLSLISLESMLVLKLLMLSTKTQELEICHQIVTNLSSVFAHSFSCEGFVVE